MLLCGYSERAAAITVLLGQLRHSGEWLVFGGLREEDDAETHLLLSLFAGERGL